MATYAIGDLQGCYAEFKQLLKKIKFNQNSDQLWLVGDLVNRGPSSLETLQALYDLSDVIHTVLGNHDLHLIACAYGARSPKKGDTLDRLLTHPQCDTLIEWLTKRPLLIDDPELGFCMTHAGIPHIWSLEKAARVAKETERYIQTDTESHIAQIFNNSPNSWHNDLAGSSRHIAVINYFTRMRYIEPSGALNFQEKRSPFRLPSQESADTFKPWFCFNGETAPLRNILFGHWATLQGRTDHANIFALDTGCIWGGALTALRLEDQKKFQVPSKQTE